MANKKKGKSLNPKGLLPPLTQSAIIAMCSFMALSRGRMMIDLEWDLSFSSYRAVMFLSSL